MRLDVEETDMTQHLDAPRFPLDVWLWATRSPLAYSPTLARAFTPRGALLLLALAESAPDDEGWIDLGDALRARLGFDGGDLGAARRALEERGSIEHDVSVPGMPRCRVNFSTVSVILADEMKRSPTATKATRSRRKPKQESLDVSDEAEITPPSILRGEFDGVAKSTLANHRRLIEAMHRLWCAQWERRNGVVSVSNVKAWRSAVNAGVKPSDFAKAVVGMRCDEWEERQKHNGWPLVVRHLDRWLANYESFRAGKLTKPPLVEAVAFDSRVVNGVTVPTSYRWTSDDDQALAFGRRFDPDSLEWVARGDPRFDDLARYNKGTQR